MLEHIVTYRIIILIFVTFFFSAHFSVVVVVVSSGCCAPVQWRSWYAMQESPRVHEKLQAETMECFQGDARHRNLCSFYFYGRHGTHDLYVIPSSVVAIVDNWLAGWVSDAKHESRTRARCTWSASMVLNLEWKARNDIKICVLLWKRHTYIHALGSRLCISARFYSFWSVAMKRTATK